MNVWLIARYDLKGDVEYLDNNQDLFYRVGVVGYVTKKEALDRLRKYKGSRDKLWIQGPHGGYYSATDSRRTRYVNQSHNSQVARFVLMDKSIIQNNNRSELVEEMRQLLNRFALEHGLWSFSGLAKMKQFLELCKKYNALSDSELRRAIYDQE